ncbi:MULTISPECIES: DNA methyltransferase [Lysinibacillus]|jgi:type II restriction/modification system DNA methylase subunit YeeA|uniref:DNA methyltransferase n=1 Tax=Lysinibacillus TaxID=400634 RepID=UPI0004DAFC3E|nr:MULTISPECIES: DNA methyltransferase [Lysinibacillus]AJK86569.1 DNA methyltransferase [Lysinibacillus fusiformis]KHK51467.1 DNA methyltransferase [Lysinibacillus sp. A1]
MSKKYLLSITEIEDRVKTIIEKLNEETFIEEFLELFDIPKTSITRARSSEGDFLIRNKIRYRKVENNPLQAIDEIEQKIVSQSQKPRYIITTDFEMLYAKDTKTNNSLAINFEDLPTYAEFFLAWNGIEKVDYQKENPADIKAAERFTKLYDELVKINPELAEKEVDGESFNLFLIRTLFLYFCEDTQIITKGSFTNVLKTRTETDGSNLNSVIKDLFLILDVPENQRHDTPGWLKKFPYVNGKLFKEPHHDLNFSPLTRKLLIEAGELLNWNEINPDILGAMIQTVANKEERQVSGMHYTSVPNILKVIKPLFLDNLQAEYQRLSDRADDYLGREITEKQRREQQRNIIKDLNSLLERMSKIKFLDPACGSGNFLIITYKELRKLEIQILVKIREIQDALKENNVYQGEFLKKSKIKLNQFSGIEIDDFAHEVAKLSLYIAEHQMNVEMIESLADYQPRILPLQESGNIIHGNALRIDWSQVVPYETNDEVYIMGNPPYIGAKLQNKLQKKDLEFAISTVLNHKKLDYISGWFYKATKYIFEKNAQYAFVTTNSINQGEQVSQLWNELLKYGEISFAYQSFKWGNSAANNAGVIVAIIGFSNKSENQKVLYIDEVASYGTNINPYLVFGDNVIVENSNRNFANFPQMVMGNMPRSKNLIFSGEEKDNLVNKYPETALFFKKYIGSEGFIKGEYRYTLWLQEKDYITLKTIPEFAEIFKKVSLERSGEKSADSTKEYAKKPWLFVQRGEWDNANNAGKILGKQTLIVPKVSSETRDYVPMGFVEDDTIVSDLAMVVYDAPIWLLGILESRMHMTWLRAVGGRLKTDYRYSAGMVYNTFPIPKLSTNRKNTLEEAVLEMLDVREEEGGTLAELYGGANKSMNARLREAHEKIDGIVERAYKQEPFKSDEERLSILLKLYQEKVSEEKK